MTPSSISPHNQVFMFLSFKRLSYLQLSSHFMASAIVLGKKSLNLFFCLEVLS